MIKAAILIDGGYFLRRLPTVRRDINVHDPKAVAHSVNQLVRGHLSQLNDVYGLPNYFQLLYRTFYYDASPMRARSIHPLAGVRSTIPKQVRRLSGRTFLEPCTTARISPCGWVRSVGIAHDSGC